MTFDEAVKELKALSEKGADTWYGDSLDKHTNVKGHIEAGDIETIIYKLRQEYAPTIEMPAKGKKYFDSAKKYPDGQLFDSFAIFDSDSKHKMQTMFGTDDIRGLTNGYQTMAGSFAKNSESVDEIMKKYTVPFMQAWLHPETIKVVDD